MASTALIEAYADGQWTPAASLEWLGGSPAMRPCPMDRAAQIAPAILCRKTLQRWWVVRLKRSWTAALKSVCCKTASTASSAWPKNWV